MEKLKRFEKGNSDRTPLHTDEINKLVDLLNALANPKFIPEGSIKLEIAGDKAVYTLGGSTSVRGFQEDPSTGKLTLGNFLVLGKFKPDDDDS